MIKAEIEYVGNVARVTLTASDKSQTNREQLDGIIQVLALNNFPKIVGYPLTHVAEIDVQVPNVDE